MRYILIDTAGVSANIIACNGNKVATAQLHNERRHSDVLLGKVDNLLKELSMKVIDLKYMGAVTGPGSFTGIRIGLATIKGFAAVNPCKLVGLSVFDVLKEKIKSGIALIKCTKTTCYYAIYKSSQIIKSGVINNDEIGNTFKGKKVFIIENDGVDYSGAVVIFDYPILLKRAMDRAIADGNFIKNNKLEAVYMQKPQAEREI